MNKNIGIIGHFLKDRDFIGNIGTLEGMLDKTKPIVYIMISFNQSSHHNENSLSKRSCTCTLLVLIYSETLGPPKKTLKFVFKQGF